MTDDVLETRLREHFAGRAPGEASPSLRNRLAAVPMGAAPAPRRPWLRLAGAAVATITALAIGVVLARIALVDRSLGPVIVGTPSTPPAAPPVLIPGDGVTTPSVALGFWLALVLIVAIVAVVVRAMRRRRPPRWVEWVIVAVVTVVLLSLFGRSTSGSSLVDDGGNWAPGPGWVERTTNTFGFGEIDRGGAFVVGPNGSFSFGLTLTNEGSLPVTIHGLWTGATGANPAGSATLAPSLVALGSPEPGQTWTGALLPGPEGAAPWRPVTLWPGETAVLSVLGDAGPCAAAPGDTASGGTYGLASIPLVLDVAGFGYVEDVPIVSVAVAGTDVCASS